MTTAYRTVDVDGVNILYREAGNPASSAVLLLHGFPTSSHMYRNLIPALAADGHRVVARTCRASASRILRIGQASLTPSTIWRR
jgi:pimeloyl-ACP methyl ester carboxylesterase